MSPCCGGTTSPCDRSCKGQAATSTPAGGATSPPIDVGQNTPPPDWAQTTLAPDVGPNTPPPDAAETTLAPDVGPNTPATDMGTAETTPVPDAAPTTLVPDATTTEQYPDCQYDNGPSCRSVEIYQGKTVFNQDTDKKYIERTQALENTAIDVCKDGCENDGPCSFAEWMSNYCEYYKIQDGYTMEDVMCKVAKTATDGETLIRVVC